MQGHYSSNCHIFRIDKNNIIFVEDVISGIPIVTPSTNCSIQNFAQNVVSCFNKNSSFSHEVCHDSLNKIFCIFDNISFTADKNTTINQILKIYETQTNKKL